MSASACLQEKRGETDAEEEQNVEILFSLPKIATVRLHQPATARAWEFFSQSHWGWVGRSPLGLYSFHNFGGNWISCSNVLFFLLNYYDCVVALTASTILEPLMKVV